VQTDTHDWVLLSNRLLLVQEVMVGLGQLSPTELVQRSAEGLTWVFDGGTLHALSPDEVTPPPLITRGRTHLGTLGEVYLAYFSGPPEPRYLALSGVQLDDPQEFRLVALYFEHLLAALSAAGYREELARQARTDWLTGLANRRSLAQRRPHPPQPDYAAGWLEARPPTTTQAEHDVFWKRLAQVLTGALSGTISGAVSGALPEDAVFSAGARIALLLPQTQVVEAERALAEAGFAVAWGWARQTDHAAETVGELLDAAEAQLEARLEHIPDSTPPLFVHMVVTVRSGQEQVQRAVRERIRSWTQTTGREVQLLLDTPVGFALETLAASPPTTRPPTLVITDSAAPPYLRDLQAQKPQGLVVGSPDDAALAAALKRVLDSEPFYDGPVLDDDDLYPREREVWRLVVRGLTNAQIGAALSISEKTVANYVTNLQDKLFLNNRVELVLFYLGKLERPY